MKEKLLAGGGVVCALAASTCCIVPLVLVSVGVSGAWIGSLWALAPYQPLFIALAVACLGVGFYLIYRPDDQKCQSGVGDDRSGSRLIKNVLWTKTILWIGTALIALSVGADYSARFSL